MKKPEPVTLQSERIRLEPLTGEHAAALEAAARDGELWNLRVTSVPAPGEAPSYIATALKGCEDGHMLPFAVVDKASGQVIGTTRYHDIVMAVDRLEIGYTWYAKSRQRSHVNTTCKLMLMQHAFETLGAQLVGWRTDNYNFASQKAIERLGARKDGVLRHHALRRDGTVRDTVMYSLTAGEWPEVKAHLEYQSRTAAVTSAGPLGRVLKSRYTHILIFFVMLAAAFAVTWVFVRGLGWLDADAARWQKIAGYFARQVVPTLGAYLLFVRFIENRRAMELDRRRALQEGGLGFAAGGLLVCGAVIVLWLAGAYRVTGFNDDVRWANGILLAGLGAGIAEEIVFRGVLYRILEERLGLRWATAISGLLFGALHIGNPGATLWSSFAIALEAGILFAIVYHVTRSLWACIGLHMGWNFFEGTIFGSNVSGSRGAHSLLASSFEGPDWLSGGNFGIEASLVTVLICLAASTALLVAHRRRAADNLPIAAPTGGAPAC